MALLLRLVPHAPRGLRVRRHVRLRELVLVLQERELLLAQPHLLARRVELQLQPPRRLALPPRLGARLRERALRRVEPLLVRVRVRVRVRVTVRVRVISSSTWGSMRRTVNSVLSSLL